MWLRDECSKAANPTRAEKKTEKKLEGKARILLIELISSWLSELSSFPHSILPLFVQCQTENETREARQVMKRWKEQRTQKNASVTLYVFIYPKWCCTCGASRTFAGKAQSEEFRFVLNEMIKCYNRFHILISTNARKIKTSLADVYGGASSRLRGSESKKLLIEVENNRRNVIGWESFIRNLWLGWLLGVTQHRFIWLRVKHATSQPWLKLEKLSRKT